MGFGREGLKISSLKAGRAESHISVSHLPGSCAHPDGACLSGFNSSDPVMSERWLSILIKGFLYPSQQIDTPRTV